MQTAAENFIARLAARNVHVIRPSLEVITELLERLGNPHRRMAVIHVAGTNGKGSVCAMIESVLRRAGFRTGLFSSPHLFRINERFLTGGEPVSDAELEEVLGRIEPLCAAMEADGFRPASYFEVCTAAALLLFEKYDVQVAVLETGMGGRWDATNCVIPLFSVITRIAEDHRDWLGDTLTKIAGEKAGIIKPDRPIVCGAMPEEARAVIERVAADNGAPFLPAESQVSVHCLAADAVGQKLKISTHNREYRPVQLRLPGVFQQENVQTAVAALECFENLTGQELPIEEGLKQADWHGRFELICAEPPVVFDVAHNPSAAGALADSLGKYFTDYEVMLLAGFMRDKDATGILKALHRVSDELVLMPLEGERAMSVPSMLAAATFASFRDLQLLVPDEALTYALDWAQAEPDRMICIAGSFCNARLVAMLREMRDEKIS